MDDALGNYPGIAMTLFMTPAKLSRAKESRDFWRSKKAPETQVFALLGCEGGETGFIWKLDEHGKEFTPAGDHGQARGPFQHWAARGDKIKAESGFDVRYGGHVEALNGAYAEMTALWSSYRHVWRDLMAAQTAWACQTELVKYYEQSRDQEADVIKRVAIAAYLQHEIGGVA